MMIDFSEIKNIYPQPKNTTYLNTSSSGLVSKNSVAKAQLFNAQEWESVDYYDEVVV